MSIKVKGVRIADFRPLEELLELEIHFSKVLRKVESRLAIKKPEHMMDDFFTFLKNLEEDDRIKLENINVKKMIKLFEKMNKHAARLKSYKTIRKYLKEYNKLRFRKIKL